MQVYYDVLPEDIIAWNVYLIQVSPLKRQQWLKRRIMFIGVPLIVWVWTLWLPGDNIAVILVSITAFAAFVGAVCAFFMSKAIITAHTKNHLHDTYATALGHRKVELLPDGLRSTSRFGEGSTHWSAIERIDMTEQHFFFFIDELRAIVIPKRSFSDPLQSQAFLRAAQQYYTAAHMR